MLTEDVEKQSGAKTETVQSFYTRTKSGNPKAGHNLPVLLNCLGNGKSTGSFAISADVIERKFVSEGGLWFATQRDLVKLII